MDWLHLLVGVVAAIVGGGGGGGLVMSLMKYRSRTQKLEYDGREEFYTRLLKRLSETEAESKECHEREIRTAARIGMLEESINRLAGNAVRAVIAADAKGIVTDWSRGAETLFGWTASEMIGKPILMLVPGQLKVKHLTGFQQVADGKKELDPAFKPMRTIGRCKNGNEFEILVAFAKWQTSNGWHFEATITKV